MAGFWGGEQLAHLDAESRLVGRDHRAAHGVTQPVGDQHHLTHADASDGHRVMALIAPTRTIAPIAAPETSPRNSASVITERRP